jgi:carboxyl-terminal processing protease
MSLRLPLIPMILALVVSLFASTSLFAFDSEEDLRLLEKARKSEASGSYSRAANFYAEYLRKNRDDLEVRDSFNRISRIQQQQVRLQDEQYRKIVVALRPSQVIDLCIYIAEVLGSNYVEADRARPEILFHHATEEVLLLLRTPKLLTPILGTLNPEAAKAIEQRILQLRKQPIQNLAELRETIIELAGEVRNSGWSENTTRACNIIILECAHGACHGLDQFTLLFTPSQKVAIDSASAGRQSGIGLSLLPSGSYYEVSRIISGSTAEEAGLLKGDLVISLQGIPAAMISPAQVHAVLTIQAGQEIELQVQPQGMSTITDLKLRSRMLLIPSVDWEVLNPMNADPIGIVRISSFRSTTTNEFREALARLQTLGIRGLLLDLRGNPGGAFKSALSSADLFLEGGTIVHAEGQVKEFNKSFTSNGQNPFLLPTVIMVDEDTASSAEILAGALQLNGKAKIVGNRTRGKGSVQCLIPIDKAPWDKLPGGVQLTVAKLRLPTGQTFERGLSPDVKVEGDANAVYTAAKLELLRQLGKMNDPNP